MPTPTNLIGIAASCASCARGSAASFATSTAKSPASWHWRKQLLGRSYTPARSVHSSSVSAAGSCIPFMPERSNASARARLARPLSSASRRRCYHHRLVPQAASSCCMLRRCPATLTTGARCARLSRTPRDLPVARSSAYVYQAYRGQDVLIPYRVFISGQKRGVFAAITREPRRRSRYQAACSDTLRLRATSGADIPMEPPVTPPMLILTAVDYNIRRVLAWLRKLLCLILMALCSAIVPAPELKLAS